MFALKFYFNGRACVALPKYITCHASSDLGLAYSLRLRKYMSLLASIGGQVRLHMVVYSADTFLYISLILSVNVN
jgi:hypothetical protein